MDICVADIGRRRNRAVSDGVPDIFFRAYGLAGGGTGSDIDNHGGEGSVARHMGSASGLQDIVVFDVVHGDIFLGADVFFGAVADRLATDTRPASVYVGGSVGSDDILRDVFIVEQRLLARVATHDADGGQSDSRADIPRDSDDNVGGFVPADGVGLCGGGREFGSVGGRGDVIDGAVLLPHEIESGHRADVREGIGTVAGGGE